MPRDRDGSFDPIIVEKQQRRLDDVDSGNAFLYAKGLTAGEISVRFKEVYGTSVSRETVGRSIERVVAKVNEWTSRPLDAV